MTFMDIRLMHSFLLPLNPSRSTLPPGRSFVRRTTGRATSRTQAKTFLRFLLLPSRQREITHSPQTTFFRTFISPSRRKRRGGERKLCDALCISEYLSNMYIKVNGDILELKLRMSTP